MQDLTSGSLTFARLARSVRKLTHEDFDRQFAAAVEVPLDSLRLTLLPAIRASSTWATFTSIRRLRRLSPADPLEGIELRLGEESAALRCGAELLDTARSLDEVASELRRVLSGQMFTTLWVGAAAGRRLLRGSLPSSSSVEDALAAAGQISAVAGVTLRNARSKARSAPWVDASVIATSSGTAPQASVVIVSFDEPELAASCAAVVAAVEAGAAWELLIANNGPPQPCLDAAAALDDRIRVIEINTNRGFGEACNIAAEHARASHLVFLNPDVFVADNWLRELLDAYIADETVGILGATLVSSDGRVQEAGSTMDGAGYVRKNGGGSDLHDLRCRPVVATDHVSAACAVINRSLFEALGGFDYRYFPAYCEDLDLSLKARSAGLKVAYSETLRVLHFGNSADTSDAKLGSISAMLARNRFEFIRKWGLPDSIEGQARFTGFDAIAATTRDAVIAGTGAEPGERFDVSPNPADPAPATGDSFEVRCGVDVSPSEAFESVIHAVVSCTSRGERVAIVTPAPWSKLRVLAVADTLGRPLEQVAHLIEMRCKL